VKISGISGKKRKSYCERSDMNYTKNTKSTTYCFVKISGISG
jgi:hypothetical protein